jgi:hypothetical protein
MILQETRKAFQIILKSWIGYRVPLINFSTVPAVLLFYCSHCSTVLLLPLFPIVPPVLMF